MKEETFDFSKVPTTFGMCAAENCPLADTCLRRIAYNHVPSSNIFLPILNPAIIKAMDGKCTYYRSNKKLRYAKGFTCTTEALTVRVSSAFRNQLIYKWGIRTYYKKRKGESLTTPAEQWFVIALARKLGVNQEEYFDGYVEEYYWG